MNDGVIDDPRACKYDSKSLVGTSSGSCGAFTAADADVINKIWEGPRRRDGTFLWYGLPRGAAFALSATGGTPPTGRPFAITLDWFRYFLTQNPQWDWATITHASYEQLWDQSVEQYGAVFGTDNPNLSAFRDRGGKLILWHGWADPLIYAEGTIDYYTRVQQQMGGPQKTSSFARLFMAPWRGPLCRRSWSTTTSAVRLAHQLGRTGTCTRDAECITARRCGSRYAISSAVPVSARRAVQRQGKY